MKSHCLTKGYVVSRRGDLMKGWSHEEVVSSREGVVSQRGGLVKGWSHEGVVSRRGGLTKG